MKAKHYLLLVAPFLVIGLTAAAEAASKSGNAQIAAAGALALVALHIVATFTDKPRSTLPAREDLQ